MILVCFGFLLKQTFQGWKVLAATALACTAFVVWAQGYAIEQSKSQIADWLQNPALMLDTSVVLFIDVFLQTTFAMLSAYMLTAGRIKKRTLWLYRLLRLFPGLLFFPVLFYMLVQAIFLMTGASFSLIAWSVAITVGIAIPLSTLFLRWLLPEKEIRLELLFLLNILIGIIGVVATVNGRTAVIA